MASVDSFEKFAFEGSDAEESLDWNERNTHNFWLGNRFFESQLSHCVLRSAPGDSTYPELESALHDRMRSYPYDEQLKLLQNRSPPSLLQDNLGGREGFIAAVGAIVRKGRAQDKEALLKSLRDYGDEDVTAPSGPTAPDHADEEILPNSAAVPASPLHVIALKEHGDRVQETPQYVAKKVSLQPPRIEVTLNFQGWHTLAQGRSKKEAQQKAAMAACRRFNVPVD